MGLLTHSHLSILAVFGVIIVVGIVDGVKIGMLNSLDRNDWQYLYRVGSSVSVAEEDLVKDGVIANGTISSIVWRDTNNQSDGLAGLVELVLDEKVDVVVGPPASHIMESVGFLASAWNVPLLSYQSNSHALSDKKAYTTLVRFMGPVSEVGYAVATLFKTLGWSRIGLFYNEFGICKFGAMGIQTAFKQRNMTVMISRTFDDNITDLSIADNLNIIKRNSRIIYACGGTDLITRRILIQAFKLGMCDGKYLFLSCSILPATADMWKDPNDPENDAIAMEAHKYMIRFSTAKWKTPEDRQYLAEFKERFLDRMLGPPWFNDEMRTTNMEPILGYQNLYEAIYLFGIWINHTQQSGQRVNDGRAFFQFSLNKSFPGIPLSCDIGRNGDRIPQFWLQQIAGSDGHVDTVAITETKHTGITELSGFSWLTANGQPTLDMPVCGFYGELCDPLSLPSSNNDLTIILTVMGCVFLISISIAAGVLRKVKLEEKLLQSVWRIELSEIDLQKIKMNYGSRMSNRSVSAASTATGSTVNIQQFTTNVALVKGQMVSIRRIQRTGVVSKADMYQMKAMRELVNENVNPFVGACFDQPTQCLLFQYCAKGSLQDILENDEIKLDANFKKSLTMDLVQGMLYLHNSRLGCHGRLKSTNCLVDNRWVLKVTDYGVERFLDAKADEGKDSEYQKYKSLLWTAPELLTSDGYQAKGTKEGDVYSFSIILHEIFYRMGTFARKTDLTAKEIIDEVKLRGPLPCRPEILAETSSAAVSPSIVKLMKLCWHDAAAERPSFANIRTFVKKNIQQGKTVNIVDVILNRLEKYASNLEELVDQRTQQLVQEKQKSDRLLYRMMPQACADRLKVGEQVHPEIYASATIFFSDIVGFTKISAQSSPMQVVDFLNDLYTCFDDVIDKYDAYKVETIGDAYLVVSGVPVRNDDRHAGIIADMSLDIVAAVGVFKLTHLPNTRIKVRVGCHTGSCCAGIVGLSMPRYCLFGDTVNTASRMESNGEAQKIHLSEATNNALHKLGGYITEFRDEIDIKGKGLMKTYWLIEKRTTKINSMMISI